MPSDFFLNAYLQKRKRELEEMREEANKNTKGVPEELVYKANQLIEARLEEVNKALAVVRKK
jgi:hypothetical protein